MNDRKIVALGVMMIIVPVLLSVALVLTFAVVNSNKIAESEKHACQALDLLIAIPAPKPVNPARHQSQELNYKFHEALVYWHDQNGC